MKIIVKGINNSGSIDTDSATANECLEACVGAMLIEGYCPYTIAGAIRTMARKMDDVAKKEQ